MGVDAEGLMPVAHLRKVNSETLCGFAGSVVTAGATVRTDGWNVDDPLAETFGHQSVAISRTGQPAHVALPGVHRLASLLKRWPTGTLDSGYSIDQLDYYLDEFTFRCNRRTARSRGLPSYRLLQQAVATDPHPYRELTTAASLDRCLWPWPDLRLPARSFVPLPSASNRCLSSETKRVGELASSRLGRHLPRTRTNPGPASSRI
jgi:hypothetical protein